MSTVVRRQQRSAASSLQLQQLSARQQQQQQHQQAQAQAQIQQQHPLPLQQLQQLQQQHRSRAGGAAAVVVVDQSAFVAPLERVALDAWTTTSTSEATAAAVTASESVVNRSLNGSDATGHDDQQFRPGQFYHLHEIPHSLAAIVLLSCFVLAVIGCTLVGNTLVCLAVGLVRKLRSQPSNYLLVSLAVADLCVGVMVMPLAFLYLILGRWPFGQVVCDVWTSADVTLCTASILNLCAISVDRYSAIVRPLTYGPKRTGRLMLVYVLIVWVMAFLISFLPPIAFWSPLPDGICQVSQNTAYQVYATMGSFYIPATIIMLVNYKIFKAARRLMLADKQTSTLTTCRSECMTAATSPLSAADHRLQQTLWDSDAPANGGVCQSRSNWRRRLAPLGRSVSHRLTGMFGHERLANGDCRPSSRWRHRQRQRDQPTPQQQTRCCGRHSSSTLEHQNQLQQQQQQPQQQQQRWQRTNARLSRKPRSEPDFRTRRAGRHQTAPNKSETKAMKTLGLIVGAFITCWLPFFTVTLIKALCVGCNIPNWLEMLVLWLGYANSTLNPLLYAKYNKDFRIPFREMLCCRFSTLRSVLRMEEYLDTYGSGSTDRPLPPPFVPPIVVDHLNRSTPSSPIATPSSAATTVSVNGRSLMRDISL